MARITNYRQMPNAAFETDKITGEGYRVLAAVQYHDRNGKNGRGCDAKVAKIAERALCDISTVKRWLGRLVDMKLIELEKRSGRSVANVYRVVYSAEEEIHDELEKGGCSATPFDMERVALVHERGGTATILDHSNQPVTTPKDTAEGYTAKRIRIHSGEPAPFYENGASIQTGNRDYSLDQVSQKIVEQFPSDASRFANKEGALNVGGFLAWADRKARQGILSKQSVESLFDIADIVMENYDCGRPEYGTAYRIVSMTSYDPTTPQDSEDLPS